MDDEQYRQTRAAIEQPRCCYEKAIQYGYFTCRWHRRIALGERESLHCMRPVAFDVCSEFYAKTLSCSGFALGTTKMPVHLSFNQAMKIQIGGMRGVISVAGKPLLEPGLHHSAALQDISDELVRLTEQAGDHFECIDFSAIVPQISNFSLRKRR